MKEVQVTLYECDECHLRSASRTSIERCEKHHAKLPFFKKGDRVVARGVSGAQASGAVAEVFPNPNGHRINYCTKFIPDERIESLQLNPTTWIHRIDPRVGVLMNEDELWPEDAP